MNMASKIKYSSPSELGNYIKLSSVGSKVILFATLALAAGVLVWSFFGSMNDKEYMQGVVFPNEGTDGVWLPNNGVVKEMFIHKGDAIEEGQTLALVSVGEAYNIVSAPFGGVVLSYIPENESFNAFEDIVNLLSTTESHPVTSVTAFVNFKSMRFIAPGQTAQITPANETRERVGYVRGKVVSVSAYHVTKREAVIKLQNQSLADEIFPNEASVFEVKIEMQTSPDDPGGLDWSFKSKNGVDMSVGTFCNIEVITKSRNIFRYMLENVSDTSFILSTLW